jgi:peptidoglycan/xylan/chitin deacetylase (PgdA/CDA1 family)
MIAVILALIVFVAIPGLLLYGTLVPNAQLLGPVVTCFDPAGQEVWLTIDDGPTDDTLQILDALGDVRATFFVKGMLARARPELIDAIRARGHGIANHSDTHPSGTFWCLGPRGIAREIDGGVAAAWFRAPVGMKNPFVHPALRRRGMRLIGWSARGFDAVTGDVDRVVRRIVPRVFPGAIVVMHQGRAVSAPCIARVVAELRARGYRFVIPDDARLKTKR